MSSLRAFLAAFASTPVQDIQDWFAARQMIAELKALSPHLLKDIGIESADIPAYAKHAMRNRRPQAIPSRAAPNVASDTSTLAVQFAR